MITTLRKIYAYKILDNFMPIYALYAVMFAQRGGLDTLQISTLFIIWTASGLVFEVPTGALADRYTRKNLLAVGQCIRGFGYVLWLVWPSYWGFAIGFVCWGIGESLDSGTFQALAYDELKADGLEREYASVIGRTESLSLLVSLVAVALATPVYRQFGYSGLILVSVGAALAAAGAALSLPKQKRQEEAAEPGYLSIIRDAAREVARSPVLLRVIGFGVLLATLYGVIDEYSTLYLDAAGVQTYLIPVVAAVMYFPAIAVGFAAGRVEQWRGASFMVMVVAAGLALFGAGRLMGGTGIAGFAVFLLLTKLSEIVYGARLQHGIKGKARSTITSINGLGVSVAAIVAYLIYGVASNWWGTAGALEVFGLGTAIIGVLLLATRNSKRVLNSQAQ
jgi:MFS family permease